MKTLFTITVTYKINHLTRNSKKAHLDALQRRKYLLEQIFEKCKKGVLVSQ